MVLFSLPLFPKSHEKQARPFLHHSEVVKGHLRGFLKIELRQQNEPQLVQNLYSEKAAMSLVVILG